MSPTFTQDLIGLRTLDERRAIAFETFDGEHTVISDEFFKYLVRTYLMDD